MDRMMPVDIERTKLRKSFRGYDREQVRTLLEKLSSDMESLLRENDELKAQNAKLKADVERFEAQESTLKEALILAQKTADETRANAHREADLIVEEARRKAAEAQRELAKDLNDLRFELEKVRQDKRKFVKGFKSMLEEYLADLAEQETPLTVLSNEPEPSEAVER